uniref:tumor necrosis factor alpha-induced protein 2 n=1 Tax=Ictidomys tridecemlineatus TaxID=43179 RepID=UPI001A9F0827|nr:tumor necrosis factor alpha-induced protein 2 [Ictidomys tridecemlineatus]
MLKMMTFFQGLPGQQSVLGTLNFPGSPQKLPSVSESESEASMSEASSEDLVPPPEAVVAPDQEQQEAAKKKKPTVLSNMFSIFTKGKKKRGQPSLVEPPLVPESKPGLDGPPIPTVEELKAALEQGRLEAARPLLMLEQELAAAAAGGASEEELVRRQSKVEALYVLLRDQVLGVLRRPLEAAPERLRQALAVVAEQEREDRQAVAAAGGAVVERLKPLFPAEFGVVATYAESYHQHFAAHLASMAQFELCERDTYLLLLWVQNLYPNDILNSPKLAEELQDVSLGSLLPPKQIRLLEATFLSSEAANVKELMARALEMESQHWAQDVAPLRLDGHCHSELAIDIIQIVSQGQAKAENITPDLGTQMKQVLLVELSALLRRWVYPSWHGRCLSPSFTGRDQTSCLSPSQPLFKRFTQTRWAVPEETLEEIIGTVEGRLPEFSELHDCFREELLEAVHLHLVKEYIIRLSKRRLVLKTAEQQQQLARHILANASVIQDFCTKNGSTATWLNPALPTLAEIIRLQDPSAIKIEVATYATWYPDFSKGHLNAILAIKGNLTNSEVKSIRNILDINTGAQQPSRSLFSLIKVG